MWICCSNQIRESWLLTPIESILDWLTVLTCKRSSKLLEYLNTDLPIFFMIERSQKVDVSNRNLDQNQKGKLKRLLSTTRIIRACNPCCFHLVISKTLTTTSSLTTNFTFTFLPQCFE